MGEEVRQVILDTPEAIQYYQLATLKSAIFLESKGLKHSSGKSAKAHACQMFKLKKGSTHEAVIEHIGRIMGQLKERFQYEPKGS